jgi:hypothetical protein
VELVVVTAVVVRVAISMVLIVGSRVEVFESDVLKVVDEPSILLVSVCILFVITVVCVVIVSSVLVVLNGEDMTGAKVDVNILVVVYSENAVLFVLLSGVEYVVIISVIVKVGDKVVGVFDVSI